MTIKSFKVLNKTLVFSGDVMKVSGIDILDGTAVIDIKPFIPQYDNPNMLKTEFSEHILVKTPETDNEENNISFNLLSEDTFIDKDIISKSEETTSIESKSEDISESFYHRCVASCEHDDEISQLHEKSNQSTIRNPKTDAAECSVSSLNFNKNIDQKKSRFGRKEDKTGQFSEIEECPRIMTAPWLENPPISTLNVVFNPIALKQLENYSPNAKEEKYRLVYFYK